MRRTFWESALPSAIALRVKWPSGIVFVRGHEPTMRRSTGKGWLTDEIYNTVVRHVPVVTVDCLIVKGQSLLLSKRSVPPLEGYWHLPGGLLRKGERLTDCALRKAREETGLTVKVKKIVGVYADPKSNPFRHDVSISFLCHPQKGTPRGCWQAEEIAYFPVDRLPKRTGFTVRDQVSDLRTLLRKRPSERGPREDESGNRFAPVWGRSTLPRPSS